MASVSSVGNGPPPTRVQYAFTRPTTKSMRDGPTPAPVHAPPAVACDDVTNGYVPWSMSSSVPCAPSKRTRLPSRTAALDELRRLGEQRHDARRELARACRMTSATRRRLAAERARWSAPSARARARRAPRSRARSRSAPSGTPATRRLVLVAGADAALGRPERARPSARAARRRARGTAGWRARDRSRRATPSSRRRPRLAELVELARRGSTGRWPSPARARTCVCSRRMPLGMRRTTSLLVADDERVPGVRAAAVADDHVGVLGEDVDDLPLSLVAPLRADHDDRGHVCPRLR